MDRTKTQFPRLLELDRQIRAGSYPNCLTFADEYEVSQKTIQRDIDFLRDQMNAPIEYYRDKKGFYYTDSNWFLPALNMSEGDLFILMVASKALEAYRGTPVAKELERIFAKITDNLPDKISLKPELVFSRFSFTSPPSKPVDEKIWTCVVRGLLNQQLVKITYHSFEAREAREQLLAPYHLANLQGEWYALGSSDTRPGVRQFALARIKSAVLLEEHFAIPRDFNAEKLVSRTFSRFVGDKSYPIRLLFHKDVVPSLLDCIWHRDQKTLRRKNGDIELTFQAAGLLEVHRWILAWGSHVRVLEPGELKTMVANEIKLMAKVY
ncbi:MAG: WYL domain-containing protein [bacterium]